MTIRHVYNHMIRGQTHRIGTSSFMACSMPLSMRAKAHLSLARQTTHGRGLTRLAAQVIDREQPIIQQQVPRSTACTVSTSFASPGCLRKRVGIRKQRDISIQSLCLCGSRTGQRTTRQLHLACSYQNRSTQRSQESEMIQISHSTGASGFGGIFEFQRRSGMRKSLLHRGRLAISACSCPTPSADGSVFPQPRWNDATLQVFSVIHPRGYAAMHRT